MFIQTRPKEILGRVFYLDGERNACLSDEKAGLRGYRKTEDKGELRHAGFKRTD